MTSSAANPRAPSRYRARPKRQNTLPTPSTAAPTAHDVPPMPKHQLPQPLSLGYQKVYNVSNTPAPPGQHHQPLVAKPATPPDSPEKKHTAQRQLHKQPTRPSSPPEERLEPATRTHSPQDTTATQAPKKLARKHSFSRTLSLKLTRSKSASSLKRAASVSDKTATAHRHPDDAASATSSSSSSSSSTVSAPPPMPQLPADYPKITFKLSAKTSIAEHVCIDQPISAVLKWLVSTDSGSANAGNRHALASTDPEDWMFWEICSALGLRRPVRQTEYLRHVVKSWPQNNPSSALFYLELGSSDMRLDISSCASLCPRRDILNAGPTGPSFKCEMYHQVSAASALRRAEWKKVTVEVADLELVVRHPKYRRRVTLPDSDLYEVAAPQAKGSPGKYVLATRSQRCPDMFVSARTDSLQLLSTNSGSSYNQLRNIMFSLRNRQVDLQSKELRIALETADASPAGVGAGAASRGATTPPKRRDVPAPQRDVTTAPPGGGGLQGPYFQPNSLLAHQASNSSLASHHAAPGASPTMFKATGLLGRAMS